MGDWRSLQRRHYPEGLYRKAEEYLNEQPQPTAATIASRLSRDAGGAGWDRTPTDRTVRAWIADGTINLSRRYQPWRLGELPAEDDRLVLSVVPFLVKQTRDPNARPSRAVADWIVRLLRIRPDLTPATVLLLAFAGTTGTDQNIRNIELSLASVDLEALGVAAPKDPWIGKEPWATKEDEDER